MVVWIVQTFGSQKGVNSASGVAAMVVFCRNGSSNHSCNAIVRNGQERLHFFCCFGVQVFVWRGVPRQVLQSLPLPISSVLQTSEYLTFSDRVLWQNFCVLIFLVMRPENLARGMTPKWGFGVAMLPVGTLCFYQAHFGRTMLPKWPLWAHLFYFVFTVFQSLGGHAAAKRVSPEPCFRQAHCFVQRPLRFLPVPPNPTCARSHIWGVSESLGRGIYRASLVWYVARLGIVLICLGNTQRTKAGYK